MQRRSLFRYSGNKGRLLPLLEDPPPGTRRVWEPCLGSGAYTLSHGLPGVGIDQDERVVRLWQWLQGTDEGTLHRLGRWYASQAGPVDIDTAALTEGERLYLKINVCGIYVGQWSSRTTYPQHSLPVDRTIAALAAARAVEVRHGSFMDATPDPDDLVFFDPPYFGTHGNYLGEGVFDPRTIPPVLAGWSCPILFTYGDGAADLFPEYQWELVAVRETPKIRTGGTVERREWATYINWPRRSDVFSMFSG